MLLEALGISLGKDVLVYAGDTFQGEYFAVVKSQNPFNEHKFMLLILVNGTTAEKKLLECWNEFDSSGLFYSEAIIWGNDRYFYYTREGVLECPLQ